jgi:2-keto-4-pentenoate hydratase/2-oxohepta-3-ene-1,7-dioic acid hydratase in catechol pathway
VTNQHSKRAQSWRTKSWRTNTANELRAGERGAGEREQQRGTEVKYYTLLIDGQEKVAVSIDGCDLFVQEDISDMNDIILGRKHAKISAECRTVSADQVEILSPIPRPLQDVICLGMNYSAHEVEAAYFAHMTQAKIHI